MGHFERLQESVDERLTAGNELILIASDLLRHSDGLDIRTVRAIHGDGLRIVDVVDDEVALGASDDADVVTHAGSTRLEVTQHAVGQHERDSVRQIHARRRLHTLAVDADDVGGEEHPHEVQGIDAEVEQRTAAEVCPHNARLVAHRVAQGRREQTGRADTATIN